MSKSLRNTFLKSCISKALRLVALFVGATSLYFTAAEAKVCFLPGGVCPGELTAGSIKATHNEQCLGYNLTQIKCKDMACQEGWECESCTNSQGVFYKCDKVPTPEPDECAGDTSKAWTPGLEECGACQRYTSCGFTGNKINGKCSAIPDYTSVDPGDCYSYIMPEYVYKVEISGADVTEGSRNDCYTNIVKMNGYTINKPASCMTYNSKLDGLGKKDRDTMCYTAGVSIGDYFSTETRDSTVFTIETKYGVDTFTAANGTVTKTETEACYRAIGCNSANGWLAAKDVDGTVYEYLEKTSDGVTCRKATGCKESSQWFNYEKLGQYKGTHFMTDEKSINIGGGNTLTCYRAKNCHNRAYTSQPDARYFKFDKQSSNEYNCWVVTGKADYAYEAGDRELSYFDYTSATAYLNGTDTQVTYYIVNKDNGRNGCMQYAYESAQDTRYFVNASVAQYSNGSSTKKTCYNVTGKSDYAYDAGDRKTTYFDYTSATAYLNGTASQGTYYIVNKDNGRNGCMQYAYESEPDAKYFASNSEEQYSNGSDTKKKCWNITGKGAYAYKDAEKNTKFFAYDAGKEGYLNGTDKTEKYFDILSCGTYAYPSEPDKTYFTSQSETGYKGGVETPTLTCYNVTDKAEKAYYANERILTHFAYNESSKVYLNGVNEQISYFQAKSCADKAYDSITDTTHFAYDGGEQQYFAGVGEKHTCYNVTGCSEKAYDSKADTAHFAYDNGKKRYFNGTGNEQTCYNVVSCREKWAYEGTADTTHFKYDEAATAGKAYFAGAGNQHICYKLLGCSDKAYASKADTAHFAYDSGKTSYFEGNAKTCYNATGCANNIVLEDGKDTDHFSYDAGANAYFNGDGSEKKCYIPNGCAANAVKTKNNDYFNYDAGATQNGHTCYKVEGCKDPAVAESGKDAKLFNYNEATSGTTTCYKAKGCNTGGGALATSGKDATRFTYGNAVTQNGYSCVLATGCASGVILSTDVKTAYITYDSGATQSGYTCYKPTGCNIKGGALPSTEKDTTRFAYDSGVTHGSYSCVKATGCASNVVLAADRNTTIFTYDGGATQSSYTCHKVTGCNANKSYYTSCSATQCSTTGYKTTCSDATTSGGVSCYLKTENVACSCSEGNYLTASANHTCAQAPVGYKRDDSTSITYGGNTCYKKGTDKQCECSEGDYLTASANHTCAQAPVGYKREDSTSVTYGSKTCYKKGNDKSCSCSEGGLYTSSQNSGCNSSGYKATGSTSTKYGDNTCYTASSSESCSCSDGGYATTCTDGSCNSNGYYSKCKTKSYGSNTCYYTETTACSCSAGGYLTYNPNHDCDDNGYKVTGATTKTYGGKTCYTAGTTSGCSCSGLGGSYVEASSCSPKSCSSSNSTKITCGSEVSYGGKKCKKMTVDYCSCSSYGSDYVQSSECSAQSCSLTQDTKITCGSEVAYGAYKCRKKTVSTCSCTDAGLLDSCTSGCEGGSVATCSSKSYGGKTCYTKALSSCGSGTCTLLTGGTTSCTRTCYNGSCCSPLIGSVTSCIKVGKGVLTDAIYTAEVNNGCGSKTPQSYCVYCESGYSVTPSSMYDSTIHTCNGGPYGGGAVRCCKQTSCASGYSTSVSSCSTGYTKKCQGFVDNRSCCKCTSNCSSGYNVVLPSEMGKFAQSCPKGVTNANSGSEGYYCSKCK